MHFVRWRSETGGRLVCAKAGFCKLLRRCGALWQKLSLWRGGNV